MTAYAFATGLPGAIANALTTGFADYLMRN